MGGRPFTVRWTVQNQGLSTTESGWDDGVWLSDSPVLHAPGATETILGGVEHGDGVDPDQSYTAELTVLLSPAISGRFA